jgi:hypothetical protein
MILQKYLHELFFYENGNLYWKTKRKGAQKGKPAGNNAFPYKSIMIDKKYYLTHRLIYAFHYGNFPITVDHINGNKSDNRIENLRAATKSENQQNMRKAYSTNKSNLIGAFYSKKNKNWFSRICINNKRKWLGSFANANDAHQAYINAKREIHPACTI